MIRGRVLLSAHVSGRAARLVLAKLDEQTVAGVTDAWRRVARAEHRPELADDAAALERFVAELREAVLQWYELEGTSADGSAEEAPTEAPASSNGGALLVTAGWSAARLGITPSRARQLLRAGVLRGRQEGRVWLVDRTSVDELLVGKGLSA